jgi:hypothetical protein
MIVALSINLLFLINIVRIIVTKLRNQPSCSLSSQQLQVNSNLFQLNMALAYRLDAISLGPKTLEFQGPTPFHFPS